MLTVCKQIFHMSLYIPTYLYLPTFSKPSRLQFMFSVKHSYECKHTVWYIFRRPPASNQEAGTRGGFGIYKRVWVLIRSQWGPVVLLWAELVHADFLITRCVTIINTRCFLDRVLLDFFRSVSQRSDSPRVPLRSGCPTFWTHDGKENKVEWHKCQNKSTKPQKHVRFCQFALVFSSIHSSLLWWEIIWIFNILGGDNSSYLVCSWLSVMAYTACGAEQFMRLLSLLVLAHGACQTGRSSHKSCSGCEGPVIVFPALFLSLSCGVLVHTNDLFCSPEGFLTRACWEGLLLGAPSS